MTKHPKAMSVSSSNNEIKSKNIRGKKMETLYVRYVLWEMGLKR